MFTSAEAQTTEGFLILMIGILLSAIMILPSILLTPFGMFSILFHLLLLAALSTPFVVIYKLSRNRSWINPLGILAVLFSLCHVYLIYVSYTRPPQEFGYLGLLFAPLLEALVAIPIAIPLIFIIKRLRRN